MQAEGLARTRCYDTGHATLETANGDGGKAMFGEAIEGFRRELGAMARGVVCVAALALPFAEAVAQQAGDGDEGERAGVEEMIVTAQRREQNVLDVPLAVSVLDDAAMEELGVSSLRDLELLTPSVSFGFDNPLTIRGVGQQAWRDASAEVGAALYQNGLFYNETYGLIESGMFDLERVEVLRGPQGTLYGRNSMGGAVNFISKKPAAEFGGEALLELTTFNGRMWVWRLPARSPGR